LDDDVHALALGADGALYAGGWFTNAGGHQQNPLLPGQAQEFGVEQRIQRGGLRTSLFAASYFDGDGKSDPALYHDATGYLYAWLSSINYDLLVRAGPFSTP